jgi:hypothetical protein
MKKLMMTLAAALFATAVVAQVTSGNVVGYQTITIAAGQEYQILGCGLKDIGTVTNTINVQDFIPNPSGAGFTGGALATSDQLLVWLDGAYKTFYLYYHPTLFTSRNGKWVNTENMSAYGGGVNAQPSTYRIPAGAALWLKRKNFASAISFTTTGEVVSDASISKTLVTGYNFIGSSFPADWDLNSTNSPINWVAAGATGGALATSDQVLVWLDGTYKTFYFYYHPTLFTSRNGKWVNTENMSAYGGGVNAQPTTYKIPFGDGTWYVAKAGFSFAQPRPFSMN